jgi:hypothetical protein
MSLSAFLYRGKMPREYRSTEGAIVASTLFSAVVIAGPEDRAHTNANYNANVSARANVRAHIQCQYQFPC